MAQLVIFGAGDIARLAHFYFRTDSPHQVAAFVVDAAFKNGDTFDGLPLVSFEEAINRYPPADYEAFVAISYAQMNRLRRAKYEQMRAAGYRCVTYLSSRCTYLASPPGQNCFILEDNTVQPFVTIGNNVTLWSGNHIGHHSVIEDDVFLASQIVVSGNCHIKRRTFIGVNATLRDGITIGERCVIGAGACILADCADESVYPATRTEPSAVKSSRLRNI